jgi:hypothetical protein
MLQLRIKRLGKCTFWWNCKIGCRIFEAKSSLEDVLARDQVSRHGIFAVGSPTLSNDHGHEETSVFRCRVFSSLQAWIKWSL